MKPILLILLFILFSCSSKPKKLSESGEYVAVKAKERSLDSSINNLKHSIELFENSTEPSVLLMQRRLDSLTSVRNELEKRANELSK